MLITIKILLGIDINDYSKDQVLNTYSEVMSHKVMSYCNIPSIPVQLEDVVAEMTASLYRTQYGLNNTVIAAPQAQQIKKETVGDHTIEYATTTNSSSNTSVTSEILNDYKMQLNPFRRIKFV